MRRTFYHPYQFENESKWRLQLKEAREARKENAEVDRQLSANAENFKLANTFAKNAPEFLPERRTVVNYDPSKDPVSNYDPYVRDHPEEPTLARSLADRLGSGTFGTTVEVDEFTGRPRLKRVIKPSEYHLKTHGRNDGGPYDTRKWGPRSEANYYYAKYKAPKEVHNMSHYVERRYNTK